MTPALWRIATPVEAGAIHLIRFRNLGPTGTQPQRIHTFRPSCRIIALQQLVIWAWNGHSLRKNELLL
jgi:hypothetical protein